MMEGTSRKSRFMSHVRLGRAKITSDKGFDDFQEHLRVTGVTDATAGDTHALLIMFIKKIEKNQPTFPTR